MRQDLRMDRTTTVVTDGDASAFAERVTPFLARRAAVNSVILTNLHKALGGLAPASSEPQLWWWVEDGADVVAALMQTPPHGAYLAGDQPEPLRQLARAVRRVRPDLPSVGGPGDAPQVFAQEWATLGGPVARVAMRQGLLVADSLVEPPRVAGRHRLARPDDVATLRPWGDAFVQEATPGGLAVDHVTDRVAAGLLHVWDVDGRPVSMAAVTPAEAGVSRVQLVYTPPQQRGRGYAAACVAAVTRQELAHPGRTCMLYTDLANPTSNALYERLGYRRIGEALDLLLG